MLKITKAKKSEALDSEWAKIAEERYGKDSRWTEKHFRFKAVENGKLLGTIDGKYEPGVLYIGALITAEKHRRKGIGTALIKHAEDFGRKMGAHKVWLLTGKDWSENTFYQKLGFKLAGTLPDFYFHKGFVIYTKNIK